MIKNMQRDASAPPARKNIYTKRYQLLHKFFYAEEIPPCPIQSDFLCDCQERFGDDYALAACLLLQIWNHKDTSICKIVYDL